MPSRRLHSSATRPRSRTAPEPTRSARSMNRVVATSSGKGPTCITCSPATARSSLLVASTVPPRATTCSATEAAPSTRCSQLSSTTTAGAEESRSETAVRELTPAGSTIPRAAATVRATASLSAPAGREARSAKAAGSPASARRATRLADATWSDQGHKPVLAELAPTSSSSTDSIQPLGDLTVAAGVRPTERENLGLPGRRAQLHEVHCGPRHSDGRRFTEVLGSLREGPWRVPYSSRTAERAQAGTLVQEVPQQEARL